MNHPSALSPARPEIHGHRGCRGLRPENTLPAFLHALELGVDVLEMDVVISADRQVVVSHEPWLNPLICRGPHGEIIKPGPIPSFNLYQLPYRLIRQCDCGLPNPNFPEQVSGTGCAFKPLLGEVLAATGARPRAAGQALVGYSIEIKCSPAGDNRYHPAPAEFLALVVAVLEQAGVVARTTLLCFDPRVLALAQQRFPGLRTCLLVEAEQPWLPSLGALGFVPTTFGPDLRTVTPEAVRQLRAAYPGLRLVPWTVNEPTDVARMLAVGVDGITTDYPNRIGEALELRR